MVGFALFFGPGTPWRTWGTRAARVRGSLSSPHGTLHGVPGQAGQAKDGLNGPPSICCRCGEKLIAFQAKITALKDRRPGDK
jgi:hypothetical protein